MEQYTLASGLMARKTDMGLKFGQMVHAMKETGNKIRLMAKGSLYMLTGISMKGIGLTIRRKDRELFHKQMAVFLRVSG